MMNRDVPRKINRGLCRERFQNVNAELNLGAEICKRLKKIYFNEKPWSEVYRNKIPELFTRLKISADERGFSTGLTELDFIKFLLTCPDEDYVELLSK